MTHMKAKTKVIEKAESVKIDREILEAYRDLARIEGRKIKFFVERALRADLHQRMLEKVGNS
jgi:hypothetical protein